MYRSLLIILLACSLSQTVKAQLPAKINKGTNLIIDSASSITRINRLHKKSELFLSKGRDKINLDNCKRYNAEAERLSITIGFQHGFIESKRISAKENLLRGNYDIASQILAENIIICSRLGLNRQAAEFTLNREEYYLASGGNDYAVRIKYYEQAQVLFQKCGANGREAATLKMLGDFYQINGQQIKALTVLKRALAIYQPGSRTDLQGIYDLLGNVYLQLGDYDQALSFGLKAAETAEKLHDYTFQYCTIYNRLGLVYKLLEKWDEATFCFNKSLQTAEKYRDVNSVITVVANLSDVLIMTGKASSAVELLKGIERNYPSKDPVDNAFIKSRLLLSYVELKQFQNAEATAIKLVAFTKLIPDKLVQDIINGAMNRYLFATKQYDALTRFLFGSDKICSAQNYRAGLLDNLYWRIKLDSARADDRSAVSHLNAYISLKDSLINEKRSRQIERMQAVHNAEIKEDQLKMRQKSVLQLQIRNKLLDENLSVTGKLRKISFIIITLVIMLIGISYNRLRLNKTANALLNNLSMSLSEKNESLTMLSLDKDELLNDKELLIKEIHHRVKNNLQVIISLINSQASYLQGETAVQALRHSQQRLQAISLIHQRLYQTESKAVIDMHAYLNELIVYIKQNMYLSENILFDVEIEPIELDVLMAVPIGLIINEAVTNSITYAFPKNEAGVISVLFHRNMSEARLIIRDDGVGLPNYFLNNTGKSVGLKLINDLSKQLKAIIKMQNRCGFELIIDFDVNRPQNILSDQIRIDEISSLMVI
jgi:two-component sensor histidine kinase/tetratricopeptide (TPR) repeat protein